MRFFLDPSRPLAREVVAWLCGDENYSGRVRIVDGAHSLSHVMVVVPTAQSGRNLRLLLAIEAHKRGWGGILSPRVVLPMQLVKGANSNLREASKSEIAAAFLKFIESEPPREHLFHPESREDVDARLGLLEQLEDIWRILAGGGLLMADVLKCEKAVKVLEEASGDELERWRELGEVEANFFAFLHARGVAHPSELVRAAKFDPELFPEEISEVVLPSLADPVGTLKGVLDAQRKDVSLSVLVHALESEADKFDELGRPIPEEWTGAKSPVLKRVSNEDIIVSSDTADLAREVASDFPQVGSGLKLPSLALADGELFPEISGAFLNAGYYVHNPERHRLSLSSLGQLIRTLFDLYPTLRDGLPWDAFVALLRSDDCLRALCASSLSARTQILDGIAFAHNKFLPKFYPDAQGFPDVEISKYDKAKYDAFSAAAQTVSRWLAEARLRNGLTQYLRQMLLKIFANRRLTGKDGEDEFREAGASVWGMLDALESDLISGLELSEAAYRAVALKALDAAVYSLEPKEADAVKTEGWLELQWSLSDQFAIVGFHEGAVPDSVVGHAFLPDRLRNALGLTSNEQRMARDTWLFSELLRSHAEHAVRVYVARSDARGDICRPSRLLFLCGEKDFPKRVSYLFDDISKEAERFPRTVADAWRMRLPDEVPFPGVDATTPTGRLSASAIDQYIRCPFTYLFKFGLGMRKMEEKEELGPDDFGTLIHKVLEEYAREQIQRGPENQLTNAYFIRQALGAILERVCRPCGVKQSVNVALQKDALAGRIALFAEIQAAWAQEGWRIVERPEYPFLVQPFRDRGDDVWIKGSVDRIDFHPDYGYRIIDYKSWDKKESLTSKHIAAGGKKNEEFAAIQHLPTLPGGQRIISVQLPLYARCLECQDEKFRGRMADLCYLVLGEDEKNLGVFGSVHDQGKFKIPSRSMKSLKEISVLALETALIAVKHIRENLFWPPGPIKDWQYDLKTLLVTSPEKDMGSEMTERPAWLARQEAKLEELK